MSKSSTLIELNGNQYDKITGQLIGTVQTVAQQIKDSRSGVVDSFTRPSVATHSVHKGLQRSHTLMRSAVAKPGRAQTAPTLPTISSTPTDRFRVQRAKQSVKNHSVQHFGATRTTVSGVAMDVRAAPRIKAQTAAPAASRSTVSATAVQPMPSMVTSASHVQLERLLDMALTTADSHKKSRRNRQAKRGFWQRLRFAPKWVTIGSSLAIVALLAVFFVWQNVPQIAMRLAASRAHISATFPGYTPSGYSYASPISYAKGAITIKFKSAEQTGSYSITQETSNWDSRSLEANAIPPEAQVQKSQINGTTVYIYGSKNDAAWVNHGVRYTITDYANLNSDQILKIANSL